VPENRQTHGGGVFFIACFSAAEARVRVRPQGAAAAELWWMSTEDWGIAKRRVPR